METDELLRRRMIWFIAIWGGFSLIMLTIVMVLMIRGVEMSNMFQDNWQRAFFFLTSVIWIGAYVGALLVAMGKKVSAKKLVYISLGLIVLDGALGIGVRVMDFPGPSLGSFVFAYFIACSIFPWTIRQALIPITIIASASAFTHVVIESHSIAETFFLTVFLVIFCSPGVFISGFKHSNRVQRATNKFLNQRYGMLRQELAYARQVHEALFPAPHAIGGIRYAYQYEPMRQIGGDYLYTKIVNDQDGSGQKLSVVIVDVTGHGIPAALTVNRLHGEIDISFAENPDITPGEMLEKLNRYVHLTLAKHSIYATAVCIRADIERGVVEYASGGHPPAFIRGIDGSLRDLDPTTFVLGACGEKDFDHGQVEVEFMPGDSLIAYTDGAIEARNLEGKMLQIDGLRKILATPITTEITAETQGLWAERILNEVTTFRGGLPPDDDTLTIEIYRPLKAVEVATESMTQSADQPNSQDAPVQV
jgi:serine phosphatase RsbU (regulator of sigma subunit)